MMAGARMKQKTEMGAVKDFGIIYLKPGVSPGEWIESGQWMDMLYNEFLYCASEIIYKGKNDIPVVTLVSIRYEQVGEMEIPIVTNDIVYLSGGNLEKRLNEILKYAEAKEKYEDCAKVRDMLIDLKR